MSGNIGCVDCWERRHSPHTRSPCVCTMLPSSDPSCATRPSTCTEREATQVLVTVSHQTLLLLQHVKTKLHCHNVCLVNLTAQALEWCCGAADKKRPGPFLASLEVTNAEAGGVIYCANGATTGSRKHMSEERLGPQPT